MNEKQRDVALFRYSLIRETADESLSVRQRGRLVRELAGRDHAGPNDRRVRVARGTIDRWIRAYRAGGFEALAPVSRTGEPVTEQRLLDLAEALRCSGSCRRHDGSLSTCHANSARDAVHRLETLEMQAAPTWILTAVRRHLDRCVDAIVHVERAAGASSCRRDCRARRGPAMRMVVQDVAGIAALCPPRRLGDHDSVRSVPACRGWPTDSGNRGERPGLPAGDVPGAASVQMSRFHAHTDL